jgi:hypothetical protein
MDSRPRGNTKEKKAARKTAASPEKAKVAKATREKQGL